VVVCESGGDRGLARVLAPLAMSAELAALKIELKSWENEFENTYGRKPTPDDIRAARLGTSDAPRPRSTTDLDQSTSIGNGKHSRGRKTLR